MWLSSDLYGRRAKRQKGRKAREAHIISAANVSEELGKGSLSIKARGEQQRSRATMRATDVRKGTLHLEKERDHLESIPRTWSFSAKDVEEEGALPPSYPLSPLHTHPRGSAALTLLLDVGGLDVSVGIASALLLTGLPRRSMRADVDQPGCPTATLLRIAI